MTTVCARFVRARPTGLNLNLIQNHHISVKKLLLRTLHQCSHLLRVWL